MTVKPKHFHAVNWAVFVFVKRVNDIRPGNYCFPVCRYYDNSVAKTVVNAVLNIITTEWLTRRKDETINTVTLSESKCLHY